MRNDLTLYEEHADEWWEPRSRRFRSLRSVNRFRLRLLDRWLGPELRGATVIDLGCGGGFLAEPLAQRGARVIGCDVSEKSLVVARNHAALETRSALASPTDAVPAVPDPALDPPWSAPSYVCADARRPPLRDGCADLVLLADVLEHLPDPRVALRAAARLLRPGGHIYVNTIARTLRARLLVVTLAEGLGFLPRGTHDPRLFISPDELTSWAQECGLDRARLVGEVPRFFATVRMWTVDLRESRGTAALYSVLFEAPSARA